ncbi:MAG: glycosyltransferase family 4 protein [bacterium]|nr:glycosyltransferase family 4 protein [bacterium]
MKICFLTHNLDVKNGGGRFSLELVRQLKKIDHKLTALGLTTVDSGLVWAKNILPIDKITLILSIARIRKIFKDCDIIHALDGWPYGLIAVLAGLGLKKKIIITAIGSGSIKPLYQPLFSRMLSGVYGRADKLTAISSYTAREIIKKVPGLKIEVIPLGVDFNAFINLGENLPRAIINPYIISVGRLKPRKGYLESIRVFFKVNQKMPELKYVIVGSGRGEYFKELQVLIKKLRLEDKIIFKENISDEELAALYRGAELFMLLPQNDNFDVEGFGLVYLEAAVFGLPVIGSLDCGAEDAVSDGRNGYLLEPKDIEKASRLVLLILRDKNLRQQFSRASVELAKKMTYRRMAQRYLELYKSL